MKKKTKNWKMVRCNFYVKPTYRSRSRSSRGRGGGGGGNNGGGNGGGPHE